MTKPAPAKTVPEDRPKPVPENPDRARGRFGEGPQPNDKSKGGEEEKDAVEDALVTGNALRRPPG